ncbi:MAG: alpha-amylase [Candidatus Aureabacteria bacterium]|nr:alpha-amylase [Candidatus Auribacterota bacterium]
MKNFEPVIIYNLFPRLVGNIEKWGDHINRIAKMGFNWIYINPFHYPGFSGSLYAPKDYYAFNPIFIEDDKDGFKQLSEFNEKCMKKGIKVMMDLVINHSASDCVLVKKHPTWYKREKNGDLMHPFCVDPADTTKKTVWGDLAEIDNDPASPNKNKLWKYWLDLIKKYKSIGFKGFRADAAYKVPTELWEFLIKKTKSNDPEILFFAETLGAEESDLENVVRAGFDCVTNSSKWWDFKEDWCIDQYNTYRLHTPSISFPETHDTSRLYKDLNENINGQKMWYAFSAFFSSGVMMPLGYEWGALKRVDVVHTMPEDMEDKRIDISAFIKKVNIIKKKYSVFGYDSEIRVLSSPEDNIFVMQKVSKKTDDCILIIINKDISKDNYLDSDILKKLDGKKQYLKEVFPLKRSASKYEPRFEPGEVRVLIKG